MFSRFFRRRRCLMFVVLARESVLPLMLICPPFELQALPGKRGLLDFLVAQEIDGPPDHEGLAERPGRRGVQLGPAAEEVAG